MASKREKVVIDANIFISFLISNSFKKFDKYLETNKVKLLFSEELLNEFIEVVNRPKLKKYFTQKDVSNLLEGIENYAELIEVKHEVNICRDKKDNFLLSLCADGKADYLITGDQDLLVLKKFKKTIILKISDYLNR